MEKEQPTNEPTPKPDWIAIAVKVIAYAVALIAAAYGAQTAAALLR